MRVFFLHFFLFYRFTGIISINDINSNTMMEYVSIRIGFFFAEKAESINYFLIKIIR